MTAQKKKGTLYLVPTPLGDQALEAIPEMNLKIVENCNQFIVESFKIGRRHILSMAPGKDLSACTIEIMNKDSDPLDYLTYLDPALQGQNICLLSDAGSPTLADPGAPLVSMAHSKEITVKPLVGPSAILLALMASGLNGQAFTFHGYLSPQKSQLQHEMRKLEQNAKDGYAQIFMETPYRNEGILSAMKKLKPDTLFCIAANLTTKSAYLKTMTVEEWKKEEIPPLQKVPCIFVIGR